MSISPQATILVVEDAMNLREVLAYQLSKSGFKVIKARNGVEALLALNRPLPDLILSEVMMPEMDGFGLLSAVRATPRTKRIPLVFLAARADLDARLRAFELGANDYVVKPWDHRELRARIRALIRWTRGE